MMKEGPHPTSLAPRPSLLVPIQCVLIANRAEISSRIIRTCRKMGIKTVAVYSEADRNAPFVAQADQAVYIGGSNPVDSYLDQDKIIEAAKKTGADAIHPGYGFLSENAGFARKCQEEGLVFIGPNPQAIEAMGSKANAKKLMADNGIPVVPGYQGEDQSVEAFMKASKRIGFPVLLKATAGGGGKGMRVVLSEKELAAAIDGAKREAKNAFGDDSMILEKYIASGRHIEFQILGDQHGNAFHILERECTIQRRYQKIIEESPSPVLDEAFRQKMGAAAVKAARALQYDNAGTVEFIFDEKTKAFYFLEVNTRLQVEHPVTEEITGLDLVQLQIEVAQGLPLLLKQEEIGANGYAIECRLYAEDPRNHFLPVTGQILRFDVPEVDGLRVESAIEAGSEISIYYDPMIAKLIQWGKSRQEALRKMQYTLRQMACLGITTNQALLLHILENPDFQGGNYDTHFIDKHLDLSTFVSVDTSIPAIAACLYSWHQREQSRVLLRSIPSGWRNSFYDYQKEIFIYEGEELTLKYRYQNESFQFVIENTKWTVQLLSCENNRLSLEIDGLLYHFSIAQKGLNYYVHNEQFGPVQFQQKERFPEPKLDLDPGAYLATMPSQVIKVLVEKGQQVAAGDSLIVLSSMKMESTIHAAKNGIVEEIYAMEGENVKAGFLLLKLSEE